MPTTLDIALSILQSSTATGTDHSLMRTQRWDIFCSIVDNFGDAGVAWRLARQLAAEHAIGVRLIVDDLQPLARMVAGIDPNLAQQRVAGVEVVTWSGPRGTRTVSLGADTVAVVEAFGCGLPDDYLDAMVRRKPAPRWINLEYLSAEPWIDGCHRLVSRHPRLPLQRYFYFPGFSAGSGGLLRERDLFARRDRFRADAAGVQHFRWQTLGVAPPPHDAVLVSMFCYPQAPLRHLLDAWATAERPVVCLLPEGVAPDQVDAWTGGTVFGVRSPLVRGQLTLHRIPFTGQDDYDRVLWTCDVNFVRGEDSFVRAQWASHPLIWQAYPQAENAHAAKVAAFLSRYTRGMALGPATALRDFVDEWNAGDPDASRLGSQWGDVASVLPSLDSHARTWASRLAAMTDLAGLLVKFVEDQV